MIEGFVASHDRWVKRVDGGVIRNTKSSPDTVALVIGGGSGHYPAFAGLVGQGLAHGAAMGNLFASPSAQQVYNVAKAANNGAGVLLGYGNYAGDVLHFNQAQDRMKQLGMRTAMVAIAILLSGCGETTTESNAASNNSSSNTSTSSETPKANSSGPTASDSSFVDGVLTTPELKIEITDHKVIPVGEKGNEYGSKPVIAFWYSVTNLSGDDVSPMNWIYTLAAYQYGT